jgi:hypothetical protein
MPSKTNEKLGEFILCSRRSGKTYASIAKEVGLSSQRVQQIFHSYSVYLSKLQSGFFLISDSSRRAVTSAFREHSPKEEITASAIAETLFDGDLQMLGEVAYNEIATWLDENGYILKDGFKDYLEFEGKWRAITTHHADGRRARWKVGRVYDVVVISRDRANIKFDDECDAIRLVDLYNGFERLFNRD